MTMRTAVWPAWILVSLIANAAAQDQIWGHSGTQPDGRYGTAVSRLGPIHKGPWPAVLCGDPSWDDDRGRVRVLDGRTGSLIYAVAGEEAGERFGTSVDELADVDGDGRPDFVVGAPAWSEYCGRIAVFSGASGALLYTFRGPLCTRFGEVVAGVGDVDGDGRGDFLAAEPERGQAYLFSGGDGTLIQTYGHDDFRSWGFGEALAGGGDINGDGRPDVLIGAPRNDGALGSSNVGYVFVYDALTGMLIDASSGDHDEDRYGMTLSMAGDVDADGYDDYLVGAPLATVAGEKEAGYVRLISGRTDAILFERTGNRTWVGMGRSIAGNVDLDADGTPDFIVGGPYSGLQAQGQVIAYSGRTLGEIGFAEIAGSSGVSEFGTSCDIIEDITGDGLPDLLAGAPRYQSFTGFVGAYRLRKIR